MIAVAMHDSRRYKLVLLLSVIGMAVTSYLMYQHYKPAGGAFCNVNEFISCDVVNKSIYSEILGIPVSILGFGAYFILAFGSVAALKGWNVFFHGKSLRLFLMCFAFAGLAFSLYLTSVELFVLYAVCIFCIVQQILIACISLLLSPLWPLPQNS